MVLVNRTAPTEAGAARHRLRWIAKYIAHGIRHRLAAVGAFPNLNAAAQRVTAVVGRFESRHDLPSGRAARARISVANDFRERPEWM